MNILEFIAFVLIFGGSLYFAWRDGFEQGVSAGNRRHVKQWNRFFRATRDLSERIVGLDNRIDGIEAKLEQPDATVLYANNEPYAVIPDTKPEDAASTGYKFRCEPEMDDICKSCTRQGTSICYGCGFDHVFYDKKEEPLKFEHEPSGEVVGKVVATEDTGEGIRVKIKKEDQDADTDSN